MHRRSKGTVPLLCIAVALQSGCFGGSRALASSDFSGCWTSGDFFLLRTERGTIGLFLDVQGQPGLFEPVERERLRNRPALQTPRWSLIEGTDSIRMSIAYTGFDWTIVRATLMGDSLVGTYSDHSDVILPTPPPEQPFVAQRAPCPDAWSGSR